MQEGSTNKPASSKDTPAPILPPEGFVSIKVVCGVFGMTKSAIWRWISEGRFPRPLKIGPGTSRWDVASLRAHMAKIRGGAAITEGVTKC